MRPTVVPPTHLALLAVALLTSACWTTKQQGASLRKDVDQLKRLLARDIEQSDKERKKLQKIMEQATVLLTRNSADVGAQVDRIQAKSDRLGGQMEEQVKKVDDLSKAYNEFKAKVDVKLEGLAGGVTQPKGGIPTDKDELFKLAQSKLSGGKHKAARRLARHFITNFPKDPRVHKAQLLLGESYYAEQKFAPAIVEYKKVLDQHKRSASKPDALFKIGMSFYQLKFCSDAAPFFSQVLKKHRRSKHAARAKKVLRLIRKFRKNKKFCR
jgi:TolA-binding protein